MKGDRVRTLITIVKASDSTLADQHEAFGEIVRAFQDMAYACAYSVVSDFQLAEDAAQNAFITAWRNLHQLREANAFPGWFRRIVLTECSRLRRGNRLPIVRVEGEENVPSMVDSPQKVVESDERKRAVLAAISELPKNERIAVTLFYLNEYSHLEISRFLEVPTTTIAKRLHSARARLRGKLPKEFKVDFRAHRPSRDSSFTRKVRAGVFDVYVGEYQFELRPDLRVTIRREGTQLVSEVAGQRNILFAEDHSENELSTKEFDGKGKFVLDDEGRVAHFIYYENGQEMGRANKIK